jgi:hypothetical protein
LLPDESRRGSLDREVLRGDTFDRNGLRDSRLRPGLTHAERDGLHVLGFDAGIADRVDHAVGRRRHRLESLGRRRCRRLDAERHDKGVGPDLDAAHPDHGHARGALIRRDRDVGSAAGGGQRRNAQHRERRPKLHADFDGRGRLKVPGLSRRFGGAGVVVDVALALVLLLRLVVFLVDVLDLRVVVLVVVRRHQVGPFLPLREVVDDVVMGVGVNDGLVIVAIGHLFLLECDCFDPRREE